MTEKWWTVAGGVGAMMVGSIKTTVSEGEEVRRGQELGYFAFGASDVFTEK